MKRLMLWILALALMGSALTGTLHAQDITGTWQGTLKARTDVRLIVRISKELDGSLQARVILVDQNPPDWGSGVRANTASLVGADFKFKVDSNKVTYEGKLSIDGNSISGTWSQGNPLPLELRRATKETAWPDPTPHQSQLLTVDKDVRLEVLDWGGSGQALVFLSGLGNTAHIFDRFAPKLTDRYHVYGITRRGFGASSIPASGYSADRLADDVLEVLDSLKLDRPVVAGHSVAGEELSSIGSRHPEKVAGLVYLDAAYAYAIYDPSGACSLPPAPLPASPSVGAAIQAGTQKYTNIKSPALVVYAVPKDTGPTGTGDSVAPGAAEAAARREACMKAFEKGVPSARIVRLPGATHYLFISNEAEVLKEMGDFIGGLKK